MRAYLRSWTASSWWRCCLLWSKISMMKFLPMWEGGEIIKNFRNYYSIIRCTSWSKAGDFTTFNAHQRVTRYTVLLYMYMYTCMGNGCWMWVQGTCVYCSAPLLWIHVYYYYYYWTLQPDTQWMTIEIVGKVVRKEVCCCQTSPPSGDTGCTVHD